MKAERAHHSITFRQQQKGGEGGRDKLGTLEEVKSTGQTVAWRRAPEEKDWGEEGPKCEGEERGDPFHEENVGKVMWALKSHSARKQEGGPTRRNV